MYRIIELAYVTIQLHFASAVVENHESLGSVPLQPFLTIFGSCHIVTRQNQSALQN